MNKFKLIDEDSILVIYDRMDKNTPKYIESVQNISIPTRYEFNIKDFKKDDRIFNSDFNSRAEYIEFPGNVKYVKFYIPLNIFCDSDLIHTSPIASRMKLDQTDVNNYLETSYMRGTKQKWTIDVYLNGEKLPDKAVLLTVYQGTVDVYFQVELLSEVNEICFSVREVNSKYKYMNFTWYGERQLVSSDYKFKDENIYSLYRNGQFLVFGEDYTVQNGNVTLLGDVYEDDLFELILEGGDIYSLGKSFQSMSNIFDVKDLFMIKDNKKIYLDTIKQPISKNNIYIFVDGYKICNDDIRELNGSFFILNEYQGQKDLDCYVMVKMNYTNTEDNIKVNYKDTYSKINHLYDKVLIHRHLINKNTTIPFVLPEFFNVDQMKADYPPIYINNLVENPFDLSTDRRTFAEKAIETYIKSNSYNINHFVKQFNRPEKEVFNLDINEKNIVNYIVQDTTGLPPYYQYEFNEDRFLIIYNFGGKNYVEKIYVDDRLLPRDHYDIIFIRDKQYAYYYIKMDRIKSNSNIRMIVEEGELKTPPKHHFTTVKDQSLYELDLEAIRMSKLRYDLIKFFINKDGKIISLLNNNDYEIQIIEGKFYFKLLNTDLYDVNEIHYMNPFFIYRKDILTKSRNLIEEFAYLIDINELNDNYMGSYNNLALVDNACNNLEIYYDGFRLINEVDFVVLETTLYNSIKANKILFNIKIESGKTLSFIFKDRRETTILSEKEVTSKYGLVYLSKAPYVIDTEYYDFYLDNVKLKPKDLTIYTNNLAKINNKNYLKYFSLISNVDLPDSIIKYLQDLESFNRNSYEKFFSDLIKQVGSLDEIFNFVNDKNLKEDDIINRIEKDPNVIKFDLRLDTLYDHFEQGLIDKKIDCNSGVLPQDIQNNEIFNYFPNETIPLDAGSDLTFRYATMSCLKNCYSIIMISELFGNERYNSVENEDGEIDDLHNHPIYEYIYEENNIILDASKETPSMHKFDASEEIEVVVFGCETSV